jgi:hypothetical protein
MANRCRICGAPVTHVKICNHCSTVKEERRFIKMVNREELRASRAISDMDQSSIPAPTPTAK